MYVLWACWVKRLKLNGFSEGVTFDVRPRGCGCHDMSVHTRPVVDLIMKLYQEAGPSDV